MIKMLNRKLRRCQGGAAPHFRLSKEVFSEAGDSRVDKKNKKVVFSLKNDNSTSTDGYTPLFFRHA